MKRTTRSRPRSAGAGIVALVLLFATISFGSGCAGRSEIERPDAPSSKLTGSSYFQYGTELFLGVDVQAARIARPADYLPLYLVVLNSRNDSGAIRIGREGLVVELPDGRRLPAASYEEFEDEYTRGPRDLRMAETFVETLKTRFPAPPYRWQPLDFFPLRSSGTFPRDSMEVLPQYLVQGYVYFRLPDEASLAGRCKLLLTPERTDTTYVVEFYPLAER
jgi:hypothetical protein